MSGFSRVALDNGGVSLFKFIPSGQWSAIIDQTSTYDATADIQSAIDSGENLLVPRGRFLLEDKHTHNVGQSLTGENRVKSVLYIPTSFNMAATSVIEGGAQGRIAHLGVSFAQPNSASRGDFYQYPPGIDVSNATRFHIDGVRLAGAWDGIKAVGNAGGMWIGVLECGALNKGLVVDGALDFVKADTLHFWPFGFDQSNQLLVWKDGNTVAADFGLVDGLAISKLSSFQSRVLVDNGAATAIGSNISVLQLDGDWATLDVANSNLFVGEMYSTKTIATTRPEIAVTSGRLHVGSAFINSGADADSIVVTGGSCIVNGGSINRTNVARRAGYVTGGVLRIKNTTLAPPGTNRTVAFVEQSGASGKLVVSNCDHPSDGFTGPLVQIETDATGNRVVNNDFGSKSLVLPDAAYLGEYGPNNIGAATFTPTLTFATPGDVAITYAQQTGFLNLKGRTVTIDITIGKYPLEASVTG